MTWTDVTELARSLWTIWLVLIFAGIAFTAFRPRNKRRFEECANIPLRADREERTDHE